MNFQFLELLSLWVFVRQMSQRVRSESQSRSLFWPDALCTAVLRVFNQYIRFVQREVGMNPLISAEAALTQELQKL